MIEGCCVEFQKRRKARDVIPFESVADEVPHVLSFAELSRRVEDQRRHRDSHGLTYTAPQISNDVFMMFCRCCEVSSE